MYKYILFLLIATISINAQDTIEKDKSTSLDSSKYQEWDFEFWSMNSYSDLDRPTIEIEYGKNEEFYNKDAFSTDFNPNNRFIGKVGFADYGETVAGSGLLKYSFNSLFGAQSLGDIDAIGENQSLNSRVLSFGWLTSKGYGYTISDNFQIILTHGTGLSWNSLSFANSSGVVDSNQIDLIKVMEEGVHFGETFESGIKIRIIDNIGISATYSENLIMPRFLFWHWSLGKLIEGTSQGIASYFVDRVKTTSPTLVPILYFVVKNGISYGFHRIRENNMNWPSNTAPPLFQRNFNIGVSFIF
ncbi:MAG: hypothetical protein CVV25_14625 [Ignavibacteriae bacterium HGW-Ignavibacteriae-4]|jgi:hypothetical protein|nr:MAG: hypothetical protein CVV25_14625 [Ignavibacteriae bacterium HGW-Ignavibacteriae-4]